MTRPGVFLLIMLAGCNDEPAGKAPVGHHPTDSAFERVQSRGHTAMGVDQYTSSHRFEPLADGGRIALQRDPTDSAGVAQIRTHMGVIAGAFSRGDFSLPGFVHDRDVPGTAVMTARRSRIIYAADSLPGGGQVRLQSSDPAAVAAIHDFLAFQRRDHRSPAHGTAQ
ncbi:MAG: hypothetical protein H0T58_10235 [Gemmatimonadales bacterium]|nr:hypothetical protein [Gemmatimonadales bacterium]